MADRSPARSRRRRPRARLGLASGLYAGVGVGDVPYACGRCPTPSPGRGPDDHHRGLRSERIPGSGKRVTSTSAPRPQAVVRRGQSPSGHGPGSPARLHSMCARARRGRHHRPEPARVVRALSRAQRRPRQDLLPRHPAAPAAQAALRARAVRVRRLRGRDRRQPRPGTRATTGGHSYSGRATGSPSRSWPKPQNQQQAETDPSRSIAVDAGKPSPRESHPATTSGHERSAGHGAAAGPSGRGPGPHAGDSIA
jgi:hypothetical protein